MQLGFEMFESIFGIFLWKSLWKIDFYPIPRFSKEFCRFIHLWKITPFSTRCFCFGMEFRELPLETPLEIVTLQINMPDLKSLVLGVFSTKLSSARWIHLTIIFGYNTLVSLKIHLMIRILLVLQKRY